MNMNLESVISFVSDKTAEELNRILEYVPNVSSVELMPTVKMILLIVIVTLGIGILSRLIFGMRSNLNRAISASLGILTVYALTIVIYTLDPWHLSRLLSPLPFVVFRQDLLILLPLRSSDFAGLCSQIMTLVILAFVVNLADVIVPDGHSIIVWYLLRFLMVIFAIFLNLAARWALNQYLPGFLVTYSPMVLLILLVSCLLLGVVKLLLGLVLFIANPLLGGIYAFFFSNFVGQQLTKAVFSTALICMVFYLLEYFGYSVILISYSALLSYIPLAASLLLLWYMIGHEL